MWYLILYEQCDAYSTSIMEAKTSRFIYLPIRPKGRGIFRNKEMLITEVDAWTKRRNEQKKKIYWTFTKQKADQKLAKHYVS